MPATLKSRFPQIQAALPIQVGAALRAGTEGVAARARAAAPDRPPLGKGLPDSIEARDGEDGYGIYAAYWWYFNEFGTVRQPARPFMLPAVEAGRGELEGLVAASLRRL